MKVSIISVTDVPMHVISVAAGASRGTDTPSDRRVIGCIEKGHDSVLEHAVVTFAVSGISRACARQLLRHRLMSVVERSQRYAEADGDYIMPPTVERGELLRDIYDEAIEHAFAAYDCMLALGIPAEDARYLLPEATCTEMVITLNLRELDHIMALRDTDAAQWEIRQLVREVWGRLRESHDYRAIIEALDRRREHGQARA